MSDSLAGVLLLAGVVIIAAGLLYLAKWGLAALDRKRGVTVAPKSGKSDGMLALGVVVLGFGLLAAGGPTPAVGVILGLGGIALIVAWYARRPTPPADGSTTSEHQATADPSPHPSPATGSSARDT